MSSVQLVQKAYLVLSNGGHGKLGLLAAASVVRLVGRVQQLGDQCIDIAVTHASLLVNSYAYSSLVLRLLEYVGVSLVS